MAVPEIPAAAMTKEDAAMIHRMLVRGTLVRVRLERGTLNLRDMTRMCNVTHP